MLDLPDNLIQETGAAVLLREFGYWPSFHDAEIIEVSLKTQGASVLKVRSIFQDRILARDKEVCVVFTFSDIESLELDGFYKQNIILELIVSRPKDLYVIEIDSSVGLSGRICARHLSISHLLSDQLPDQLPKT